MAKKDKGSAKGGGGFKRKYQGEEVRDPSEGLYAGDLPKRGIYAGALVSVEHHKTAANPNGEHWVFEITEEPYKGWRGHGYTNSDSTRWKEIQYLQAGGIITEDDLDSKGKLKKELDYTYEELVKAFGPVRLQVRHEGYTPEGSDKEELTAKLGRVLPPDDTKGKKKAGKAKAADAAPGEKAATGKKKKKGSEEPF